MGELISVHVIPRPHAEVERVLPVDGKTGLSPDERSLQGGGARGNSDRANRVVRCRRAHGKEIRKEPGKAIFDFRFPIFDWMTCVESQNQKSKIANRKCVAEVGYVGR